MRLVAAVSALTVATGVATAAPAGYAKPQDRDRDGLSDRFERKRSHTMVSRADTDRDRLRDGFELRRSRTNPRRRDTDRDGLSDGFEWRRSKTDPRRKDTDRDGHSDGLEVLMGSDPRKKDGRRSLESVEAPPSLLPTDPLLPPVDPSPLRPEPLTPPVPPAPPAPPAPPQPDLTPPNTTITGGPSGTVATNSASFSFTSSEAGSIFACRVDSGAWTACSSPRDLSELSNGSHTFRVRATDAAGNTDGSPAQRTWTVNVPSPPPAPSVPVARYTYSPANPVAGEAVAFNASTSDCADAPCTYTWEDDGTDGPGGVQWTLGSGQSMSYTFEGAGDKHVRLSVTDSSGDVDSTVKTVTVQAGSPPPPPPPPPPPARCANGRDDDGDGLVDMNDPGCSSAQDDDESNAAPPPPPPPPAGLPGPSNTGVAGCPALTPRGGDMTVSQSNAVVENLDVSGSITVTASNVTIRCVRVRFSGLRGINNNNGGGTLIDRVEIDGAGQANCDGGITGNGYTARRVNIHGCEDGAKVGANVTVEQSYIHHMDASGGDPHYDGLQLMGCCSSSGSSFVTNNVTIRGNNIEPRPPTPSGTSSGATSAIIIKTDFGRIDNVLVENNRLNCGAFTVYSRSGNNYPAPTNVRFLNNRFGRCYEFGIKSFDGSPTWSGNVWDDTGQPIN